PAERRDGREQLEALSQTPCRFMSQRHTQRHEQSSEPLRQACSGQEERRESLREDATATAWLTTEEASGLQQDPHGIPATGNIANRSLIPAMLRLRWSLALRT